MASHPSVFPEPSPAALGAALRDLDPDRALRVALVHGEAVPESLGAHAAALLSQCVPGAPVHWHATRTEHAHAVHALVVTPGPGGGELSRIRGVLDDELRGLAIALGVDAAVTTGPLAAGRVGLIVSDADSTFFAGEVIDELAHHAGTGAQVAAVTAAAMRGELDFAASLHQRVATLEGLPSAVLDTVGGALRPNPGARALLARAHAAGVPVGIVSGGFTPVLEHARRELGFDLLAANGLAVSDGRVTGRVTGPVVDRAAKAAHLRAWARELGVPIDRTAAVGDGANDLDMLAAAGLGVAYAAKPATAEAADAVIGGERLDVLAEMLALPLP